MGGSTIWWASFPGCRAGSVGKVISLLVEDGNTTSYYGVTWLWELKIMLVILNASFPGCRVGSVGKVISLLVEEGNTVTWLLKLKMMLVIIRINVIRESSLSSSICIWWSLLYGFVVSILTLNHHLITIPLPCELFIIWSAFNRFVAPMILTRLPSTSFEKASRCLQWKEETWSSERKLNTSNTETGAVDIQYFPFQYIWFGFEEKKVSKLK